MSGDGGRPMIEGNCDVVTAERIQGWIFNRADPGKRLELDLLLNGRQVQTIVADQFRSDLQQSGIGDGCHAFQVMIPIEAGIDARDTLEISLRILATGEIMPGSVLTVSLEEAPLSYSQLRCLPDTLLDLRMAKGFGRARGVCRKMRGALDRPAKIALYAVNAQIVLASHRKTIAELKIAGYGVVVVNSDEHLGGSWLSLAGDLVDVVVVKRDEGRDFSSWLTAYHLYRAELEAAEHVLFINESLCGPIRPLAPLLGCDARPAVGFWALSDSYEVRYHLQSSLFILSQDTVRSRPFREFVASYAYPNEKRAVIDQGEIALSTCLISGGISTDVLCRYEELCDVWMVKYDHHIEEIHQLSCFSVNDNRFAESQKPWLVNGYIEHWTRWIQNIAASLLAGEPRNAQHVFWREMIEEFRYPFIKRELLFSNPSGVPNLSTLMALISDDDKELLMSDIRNLSRRGPPLLRMHKRERDATI